MDSDTFDVCCEIADMDPGWCRELLRSIRLIPDPVRPELTRICLRMIYFAEPVLGTARQPDIPFISLPDDTRWRENRRIHDATGFKDKTNKSVARSKKKRKVE